VAVEAAVGEHDVCPSRSQRGEGDVHLAGLRRVGFDLPAGVDVPAEADVARRVVGEDAGPPAFATVLSAVDDVAADPGLEDHLGERSVEDVLVGVPPGAHLGGEHVEGALNGDSHVDHRADRGGGGSDAHTSSWACCSAALRKAFNDCL